MLQLPTSTSYATNSIYIKRKVENKKETNQVIPLSNNRFLPNKSIRSVIFVDIHTNTLAVHTKLNYINIKLLTHGDKHTQKSNDFIISIMCHCDLKEKNFNK